MAANFWRKVLDYKVYLFEIDFAWCRTICVPIHQVLRKFRSYRYVSALLLGPDDQMWTDVGIPFVPSRWQEGSIDFTKAQHVSDKDRVAELGKIFGTFEGRTPVLVICEPEKIRSVLRNFECFQHRRVYLCRDKIHDNMLPITEGPQWRRVRDVFSRSLSNNVDIRRAQPTLVEAASFVMETIERIAEDDGLIKDGRRIFGAYTMDVIGRMIFGEPFEDFKNPDNTFAKKAVELLIDGREEIVLNTVLYPEFRRRPKYCTFDPAAMEFFKDYAIQQLRNRTEPKEDLLQVMMDAERGKNLNMDELYAQCAILIALAYHSVSFTMAIACFEISRNEEIQERLRTEIDSCISDFGLTIEATAAMKYLNQVLKEALRKCPAAVRVERVCNRNTEIEGTPIERGTVVAIPIYTLHNHTDYYDKPEVFDPDRFHEGRRPAIYTYMPFGENQRRCLASIFAMEEMRTFMAYLLSQVHLLPSKDTNQIQFDSKKNILVAKEIPFRVKRRENRVWKPELQRTEV